MAWESHLSAWTGFSSSSIDSEMPAEMERAKAVRCPRRPITRTLPAYLLESTIYNVRSNVHDDPRGFAPARPLARHLPHGSTALDERPKQSAASPSQRELRVRNIERPAARVSRVAYLEA